MTVIVLSLAGVATLAIAAMAVSWARELRWRREVKALRDSEERFRLMADRAPVILWTGTPEATIGYVNGTAADFTGLPREKLHGDGWLDVVHPDDVERCLQIYVPAFEQRLPFLMEYRVRSADGTYRWLLDKGVPQFGPDGEYSGFIGCSIDITERKMAEDAMRDSRAALAVSHGEVQQLAGRLITVHEDERRRLARELHDDLTQRLARLAIDAGRMEQGGPVDRAAIGELRNDLVRLSEDVHALSYRLHPSVLDDLGLVEALRAECGRVARQGVIKVEINTDGVPDALPAESSLCLFRVAQEALNNAARHAHASTVTVQLAPNRQGLRLAVSDDGGGFDLQLTPEHASLGLASMRERVRLVSGELDIASQPGRGTTVVAWVPA